MTRGSPRTSVGLRLDELSTAKASSLVGLKDIPMDSFVHIYKKQDDWVFPFPL